MAVMLQGHPAGEYSYETMEKIRKQVRIYRVACRHNIFLLYLVRTVTHLNSSGAARIVGCHRNARFQLLQIQKLQSESVIDLRV